jgi:hypothetical protein
MFYWYIGGVLISSTAGLLYWDKPATGNWNTAGTRVYSSSWNTMTFLLYSTGAPLTLTVSATVITVRAFFHSVEQIRLLFTEILDRIGG